MFNPSFKSLQRLARSYELHLSVGLACICAVSRCKSASAYGTITALKAPNSKKIHCEGATDPLNTQTATSNCKSLYAQITTADLVKTAFGLSGLAS